MTVVEQVLGTLPVSQDNVSWELPRPHPAESWAEDPLPHSPLAPSIALSSLVFQGAVFLSLLLSWRHREEGGPDSDCIINVGLRGKHLRLFGIYILYSQLNVLEDDKPRPEKY